MSGGKPLLSTSKTTLHKTMCVREGQGVSGRRCPLLSIEESSLVLVLLLLNEKYSPGRERAGLSTG
jgi:hypothetical protein